MTPKPEPCPKCGGPATTRRSGYLKGFTVCPNLTCAMSLEPAMLLKTWNAIPRPSTESEKMRKAWEFDPNESVVSFHDYNIAAMRSEKAEAHRDALLRFIETIPHAEECELTREPSGATRCTCYLSRIPKP